MILAILQARVSSSRLPGKVVKTILGKEMVLYEIERLKQCKYIDKLVLATSVESTDDILADVCKKNRIDVFRGNLNDVLDRYYQCAKNYQPEHVVRVTGDCPLIDPEVVDSVIKQHIVENCDYTSNVNPPTFPDGLDVEVMKYSVLEGMWKNAKLPSEREHVTLYIRNNASRYKISNFVNNQDLSAMRWTVDEPEDFELVTKIITELYSQKPNFNKNDVMSLIDKYPGYLESNAKFMRNEGLKKSILEDNL